MPLDPVVLGLTLLTAFVCTLGFSLESNPQLPEESLVEVLAH